MSPLYHFTARHHLEGGGGHAGRGIRAVGLLPNAHPLILMPPMVWLTTDGEWSQVWSPRPVPGINCDRTQVRIEVAVPQSSTLALRTIEDVLPQVWPSWREDFTGGLDLSAWRAFVGRIPPGWIRAVEYRPVAVAVSP